MYIYIYTHTPFCNVTCTPFQNNLVTHKVKSTAPFYMYRHITIMIIMS